MIVAAKLAHRKSRWKLLKIIAHLKSTREGTQENSYCWKNWSHPGNCQSLHMKVVAGRKLPDHEFCKFRSMWKWHNKRKNRVSRPKRCSGIFNASNAWTNMKEEKAGVERQNSKKGFERMRMPAAPAVQCSVLEVFVVSDLSAHQYLYVACPTWKIQS